MSLFKKDITEEKKRARVKNRRVHLANERTFLAWIRTSLGIMAFGFIIEKFLISPLGDEAIGLRQISGKCNCLSYFGLFLIFLGAAAAILSTYRFLKTEKEIAEDTFRPSVAPDVLLALLLGSIGVLMLIYLIMTV
ncbi:MAG: hypothetical protein DRG82_00555 [Deltaproteobacteria bacterium]|nr:MAG: hypothetical protein DRG82_00555 [Deltaproteobacteria bacterium]